MCLPADRVQSAPSRAFEHACLGTGAGIGGSYNAVVGGERGMGGAGEGRGSGVCVTLANCSNWQTVREGRPTGTRWVQQT